MRNSTIKDVAKNAQVSVGTVSRVINNAPNVTSDLRERVLNAIRELDFKPNQLARGLKNDKTHTIGVIISDIGDPVFTGIIKEIEKQINDFEYTMIVVSTDNLPEKEYKYINVMHEKRVDGIVISSTGKNEDYLYSIQNSGVPVILLDRKPVKHKLDAVYMDKAKAIYDVVNYLVNKGHKRIVLASGPKEISTNFERYIGYVRAYYEANLPLDESLVMYGSFTEEYGRSVLQKILSMEDRPTAIISVSVKITRGIMLEAKKMKVNFPNDLSLISYGNIEMGELVEPPLTCVDTLKEKIGRIVGDTIIKRLEDPRSSVEEIVLDTSIIEGKSVK